MTVFLTSSPGGSYKEEGRRIPCAFSPQNGFVSNLKKYWKNNSRCLFVSSDPADIEMNDSVKNIMVASFHLSDLLISQCDICDSRNCNLTTEQMNNYDVIILAGGHVPTENKFFLQLQLREKIRGYEGIIIGISAGSMNSAEIVYAQPELPGESVDPKYRRFLQGLGITSIMILPHFQDIKNEMLDGKRVIEDITFEDSMGRCFYALVDGSYILVSEQETRLYGETYLIRDSQIKKICEEDTSIVL